MKSYPADSNSLQHNGWRNAKTLLRILIDQPRSNYHHLNVCVCHSNTQQWHCLAQQIVCQASAAKMAYKCSCCLHSFSSNSACKENPHQQSFK